MAHSNRPSKRGIPGIRPGYPADQQERTEALAYTQAYVNRKAENRRANMERTRKGLR